MNGPFANSPSVMNAARSARILLRGMRLAGLGLVCAALLACQPGYRSEPGDYGEVAQADAPQYTTVSEGELGDTSRARELNKQALGAFDEGDLERAERLLRAALTADVMFGPAHNNLGKIYFEQSRLYLAAWEFKYAIRTMPHEPEPRNNLGLVLEEARKLEDAVEHYRAALEMEPDNPKILGNLVRARLRRGDRDEELRDQLQELILKDERPSWVEWAREKHALMEE